MKARMVTEVSAKLPDATGLLAQVTNALAAANVNIVAIVAWTSGGTATVQFTTGQAEAAEAALLELKAEVHSRSAVAVDLQHRPGTLDAAAHKLAEAGIYINHVYGSAAAAEGKATIIFETDDDAKALEVLKGMSASEDVIL